MSTLIHTKKKITMNTKKYTQTYQNQETENTSIAS